MIKKIVRKVKKALTTRPEKKFQYNAQEVAKLYRLATRDSKTDLFNARYFETQVKHEVAIAQRYKRAIAMILVDIDDFKKINDKYGYKMGDEMLKRVASIIRNNVRDTDVPARFGGEEFTVLLPETKIDRAKEMAERLRTMVLKDPLLKSYSLTISVGIACETNGEQAPQEKSIFNKSKNLYKKFMPTNESGDKVDLFDKANIALKYAKTHGKNQSILFNQSMSFSNVHNFNRTF